MQSKLKEREKVRGGAASEKKRTRVDNIMMSISDVTICKYTKPICAIAIARQRRRRRRRLAPALKRNTHTHTHIHMYTHPRTPANL